MRTLITAIGLVALLCYQSAAAETSNISTGDDNMSEGIGQWLNSYRVDPSNDLAGRDFRVTFEDEAQVDLSFEGEIMSWHTSAGHYLDPNSPKTGTEAVRITSPREGIYVAAYATAANFRQTVSLVLDLNQNIATAVVIDLPRKETYLKSAYERWKNRDPRTDVTVRYISGAIDNPLDGNTARHTRTNELVGKRLLMKYSDVIRYEHIYLTPQSYTWHCLQGSEAGGADTEQMHYLKLDEALYLLVWSEKAIPGIGSMVMDLKSRRVDGRFFGYNDTEGREEFSSSAGLPMGGYLTVLNETDWDLE